MTATFDAALTTDKDRVRWHIGDTDMSAPKLQDETILAVLIDEGDVGHAVIACLNSLLATLSDPSFTADWLRVNPDAARNGILMTLIVKRREFGIREGGLAGGKVVRSHRPDFSTPALLGDELED
jgi:hypothetical protein